MYYIDEFLLYLQNEKLYVMASIQKYRLLLKRFKLFCEKNAINHIKNLTNNALIEFLEKLKEFNIGEQNYYIRIYQLKIYLKYLENMKYIYYSFLDDYIFPKYLRKHHPVLTHERMEKVLSNISTNKDTSKKGKVMIELAYSSALRTMEIGNLKISDIDYENGTLFIRQSKMKKDRIVPIGNKALEIITKYIKTIRMKYLKHNSPDNIFLNFITGHTHDSQGVGTIMRKTFRENGYHDIRPYSIRGTAATALYLNGMAISYINKLLGHTDLKTTQIYVRVNELALKKQLDEKHPRNKMDMEV